MYYWKNNNNNKCKIKEITIACFINSLHKFTKTLHKTPKIFSLWKAIFLAMLGFFCEAIFDSKFGPWAFDRVWHAGPLHRPKSDGISDQIFGLISPFFSNRWLQVVRDRKSSQEYPGNAGVPQGSILGPTPFLLYINDLPDVICDSAVYADDTTFYSKCDQASGLWQKLELASELDLIYETLWTGQEVSCWFQCWENSTGFVWPV